jgi:outer membrane protein assembly factor BamB
MIEGIKRVFNSNFFKKRSKVQFKKTKTIESFEGWPFDCMDKVIRKGYLVYCNSNSGVKTVRVSDWEEVVDSPIKSCYLNCVNDLFFYSEEGKLYRVDFDNLSVHYLLKTSETTIFPLSEGIYYTGSYNRKEGLISNAIVSESEVLYDWKDDKNVLIMIGSKVIFQVGSKCDLGMIDLDNGEEVWKINIGNGIAGRRFVLDSGDGCCIIQRFHDVDKNDLIKLDSNNGNFIWELNSTLHYYSYSESENKLYGLGGKVFEVINTETGEREKEIELSENLHVPAHLTYFDGGYLYFSGYKDSNIPVFGAVDVRNGNLEFIESVEMPGERSFRKGLGRPVVIDNRLYVRDALGTLHVYERAN